MNLNSDLTIDNKTSNLKTTGHQKKNCNVKNF